jgi:hypothetical protein
MWTEFSLGCGLVMGYCENGNEPLRFIKGGGFVVQLSNYQLLKKDGIISMYLPVEMATPV